MIDMEAWSDYYSNLWILEKIAKECRYREVIIIRDVGDRKIALRPLKIFKAEHLQFWIERLHLTETLFDIYISNASVKLPPLPSDLSKLSEARQHLNENWFKLITGYDIFADVDVDDESQRDKAKEYALSIGKELKKEGYNNVEVWDTSRGFHVIDKGRFTPEFVKEKIMDICCRLNVPMSNPILEKKDGRYIPENGKWVKVQQISIPIVDKPNCDTSIYDIRRIRRVPYSLHSKTGKPMIKIWG